jgi:hypothetical protein
MLDFVNPIGAGGRFRRSNRLSGDDEAGGKRLEFHGAKRIGRRGAGNNGLSVAFRIGPQLTRCWKNTGGRIVEVTDNWSKNFALT